MLIEWVPYVSPAIRPYHLSLLVDSLYGIQCMNRNDLRKFLLVSQHFYMICDLSISVCAFPIRLLTWLSVDEILLLRYGNWSLNFSGLTFNVEIASFRLKCMNFVIFMPLAVCSRPWSGDSAWEGVFFSSYIYIYIYISSRADGAESLSSSVLIVHHSW